MAASPEMAWFTKFYPETTVVTKSTSMMSKPRKIHAGKHSSPAPRVLIDDGSAPSYDFCWEVCGKWFPFDQDACLNVTLFSLLGDAGAGSGVAAGAVGAGANRTRTAGAKPTCAGTVVARTIIARTVFTRTIFARTSFSRARSIWPGWSGDSSCAGRGLGERL